LSAVEQTFQQSPEFTSWAAYDLDNDRRLSTQERQAGVNQIYQQVLGRGADQPGLSYWQQSGRTPGEIMSSLVNSGEFKAWSDYDADKSGTLSPQERQAGVNRLYQGVLGRAGEPQGVNYWSQSGATPDQIMSNMTNSDEFKAWSNYDADKSGTLSQQERQAGVNRLYQGVLGRAGEPQGVEYWSQTGLLPEQIRQEMTNSGELKAWLPYDLDQSGTISAQERQAGVGSLYQQVLGRAADEPGMASWVQSGLTPDQLRQQLGQSDEFKAWSKYDADKSGTLTSQERGQGVSELYQGVLGRASDPSGLAYWSQAAVGSPDALKRAFQESAEFKSWAPYDADNSGTLTQDERRQGIDALYQSTFGRAADKEGATFWLNTMLTPDQLLTKFRETPEWRDVSVFDVDRSGTITPAERQSYVESVAAKGQVADLGKVSQPVDATKITTSPVVDTGTTYGGAAPQTRASSQQITDLYQSIFGRAPDEAGLDYWTKSGLSADQIRQHFLGSTEWGALSPFDVNVDQQISAAERANYLASLQPKPAVELPKGREPMALPKAPDALTLPTPQERVVPTVTPAGTDQAFRESAVRTFDPVTGTFQYTTPTKLSSATGAGMNFVPPTVTSRPRQLLNVAYSPTTQGYSASTNTLYQSPVSASQAFAADRTGQLRALQGLANEPGTPIGSANTIRLQSRLRSGEFNAPSGGLDMAKLRAAYAAYRPSTAASMGPPAPSTAPTSTGTTGTTGTTPEGFRTVGPVSFNPYSPVQFPVTSPEVPQGFQPITTNPFVSGSTPMTPLPDVPEDFQPLSPVKFIGD
jgi:hypothetical protein